MNKLITMVASLLMVCAFLGGCYSKSCDTTCPAVKYNTGK